MRHPEGIEGLEGRAPYGAVVSMGRKAPGGRGVTQKDMFHIVSPFEDSSHVRPYLAEFQPFHNRPPERRRLLRGMLVYPRLEQSITYRLSMQSFPKGYPAPHSRHHMLPVCEGNGVTAVRWKQDDTEDMMNIRGCGELCEFRQAEPPPCKPYAKLAFMLQWDKPEAPTPLCRLVTRGRGSTRNIKGFIEYLEGIAKDSGVLAPNWMGLKFTIQMVQKTNPEKRRKWYEVVLSPESDLLDFLRWQHKRMAQLRAPLPELALPDMREEDDIPAGINVVYEDITKVEVGNE